MLQVFARPKSRTGIRAQSVDEYEVNALSSSCAFETSSYEAVRFDCILIFFVPSIVDLLCYILLDLKTAAVRVTTNEQISARHH